MAMRFPAKDNSINVEADYGEIVANTPSDAPAPPPGDGDTWAADPMETKMRGPLGEETDHNSGLG
jgi:hypothetical protein